MNAALPDSHSQETAVSLQRIIAAVDGSLAVDNLPPFSAQAVARLREKVNDYVAQIIAEPVKVSKRHQADAVSLSDVEQVGRYLLASNVQRVYKHLGTFGGIAFGAGLSNVLSMVTTNQFNATGVLLSVGLSVVGACFVALHLAKD